MDPTCHCVSTLTRGIRMSETRTGTGTGYRDSLAHRERRTLLASSPARRMWKWPADKGQPVSSGALLDWAPEYRSQPKRRHGVARPSGRRRCNTDDSQCMCAGGGPWHPWSWVEGTGPGQRTAQGGGGRWGHDLARYLGTWREDVGVVRGRARVNHWREAVRMRERAMKKRGNRKKAKK